MKLTREVISLVNPGGVTPPKKVESTVNSPTPIGMSCQDIFLPLNHLFNAAAKRAFRNEVKSLTVRRKKTVLNSTETEEIDQVKFFGTKAIGQRQIFDAAQKVANQINVYAALGYVTGALYKLILVRMATEPHELDSYLVLSYVALSPAGYYYLANNPSPLEVSHDSYLNAVSIKDDASTA